MGFEELLVDKEKFSSDIVLDLQDFITYFRRVIRKRGYEQIEKVQDNREAEREAAKFLFQKPLNTIKDDYVRKSVELVRDACEGRIKYNSPEWIERFEGIYGKGATYHV